MEDQDKPEGTGRDENANPERQGKAPAWKPTDEPEPNEEEGTATGPPPESAPGDSGHGGTPRL